jgi:hypothetical protein
MHVNEFYLRILLIVSKKKYMKKTELHSISVKKGIYKAISEKKKSTN